MSGKQQPNEKKKASRSRKNNNNDETSTSSKHDTKGQSCLRCKERKKKCDRLHPSCSRCLKSNAQCLYRMKVKSTVLNRSSPEALQQLLYELQRAEELGQDLDNEILRQLYEIERLKRAKLQVVVRSVTLYKSSQLTYMLNCYMPALQPTTGNQVPYIKISHFFRDTNPARQGAMFAMLANAALMLEDTEMADRFRIQANKCLSDAGPPTPQNMALYVSALIDLGTHHQAFFDFETAIKYYYQIKGYAEKYPHLFLAALKKKRNNQRSLAYQDDRRFQVKDLQEKEHYSGRFHEMRQGSPGYENNNNGSPNLSNNNNDMEEDESSDSDLPPEDDGKTTYAVASYALPKTAEESLLFHLGYAFEALMLMTRDRELEMIRKEIQDSNEEKLGEHNVFNEIRERLHALNQIATYCLKKGVIMQWEWFNAELKYVAERMELVEFGRRIFLFGQKMLVNIHGLMAAKKKEEALEKIDKLILFAQEQFYYGKTNVLGYGYLFSACVCYQYLQEYALFQQTRDIIASYKVPGLLLAERCLDEIDKYVAGETANIAPYFAKLAAILEADRPEQTKFVLLEITDARTGQLTVEGRALLPESLHHFMGHVAYTQNMNNNILQAQDPSVCESNSNSFSYEPDQPHAPVYQYGHNNNNNNQNNNNNNNNNNRKQDVYDSEDEFEQKTSQDYQMVEDLDYLLPQDEMTLGISQDSILMNALQNPGNRAPHLEHNHQIFTNNNNNNTNHDSVFYVYGEEYNNNNTIGNYTMGNNQQIPAEQLLEVDQYPEQHPIQTEQLHEYPYFPVEE